MLVERRLDKYILEYALMRNSRMIKLDKAEIDVFLELSLFFNDPADAGNLISGSSAFSKTSLNIWKFMVHILLKPGLENFEHYFNSMLLLLLLSRFSRVQLCVTP